MCSRDEQMTSKHVQDWEFYERLDTATFSWLVDHDLFSFRFCPDLTRLEDLFAGIDKFFWTEYGNTFADKSKAPCPMQTHRLLHQFVHHWFGRHYGARLASLPHTTLFIEALAGGVDIFLGLLALEDIENIPDFRFFDRLEENVQALKVPDLDLTQFMDEDPFGTYRAFVLSYFEAISQTYHCYQSHSTLAIEELGRQVKTSPFACFYLHKDFSNFALYAIAFCSNMDVSFDLDQVRRLEAELNHSTSLVSFLESFSESCEGDHDAGQPADRALGVSP